jgi:hypothetical protein
MVMRPDLVHLMVCAELSARPSEAVIGLKIRPLSSAAFTPMQIVTKSSNSISLSVDFITNHFIIGYKDKEKE